MAQSTSVKKMPDPTISELFVFGRDKTGRERGARFLSSTDLAVRAAVEDGYKAVSHPPSGFAEVAMDLPLGQISPSGRLSIPIIQTKLFRTVTWAERQIEQMKHAELHGIASSSLLSVVGVQGSGSPELPAYTTMPASWQAVGNGNLVLIHGGPEVGWWDAVVVERIEDILTLMLRDDPWQGVFYRHRNAVALINSGAA
ncbi:hypothetical protein FNL56_09380 [Tardiphaga sp. vice304]|uniref:hypothetical protein n=1 Tax=unclassified Tardiphaga TaxID=2631404 RepID=UPI001162D3D6|nr:MULTISPECIES: hypothetical protein [unclassified Tardiphaga]QDM16068.1 hypothetical protein FNL53_09225 [Tardiphaga sp. vice278]QDM26276.1 hypothetical protein FNL56_09380 [Tardiphaga sp. vice304]